MKQDTCPYCESPALILRWRRFGNRTRHIEGKCWGCQRFIQWVSQTNINSLLADEEEVRPLKPREHQLSLFGKAGELS